MHELREKEFKHVLVYFIPLVSYFLYLISWYHVLHAYVFSDRRKVIKINTSHLERCQTFLAGSCAYWKTRVAPSKCSQANHSNLLAMQSIQTKYFCIIKSNGKIIALRLCNKIFNTKNERIMIFRHKMNKN